jgi:hypothetical protein
MPTKVEVCKDTPVLKAGQTFEWTNPRDVDCKITGCKPPLTRSSYLVPKRGHKTAVVDKKAVPRPPNHYPYDCDCCGRPQPKIIIGT